MILSFPLPAKPWSTNDEKKLHYHKRAELTREWRLQTRWWYVQAQTSDRALPPSIVTIHIPFKTNHRRDPMNYCGTVLKAVVDGLVDGGAWPDDTPDYVGHREPILYKGKMVVVEINPKEET